MNLRLLVKRVLPDFNHRMLLQRLIYLPADLLCPMPEMVPPRGLRFDGGNTRASYIDLGKENLGYFIETGGLKPEHDVLDVGCGIGRLAAALTSYLTTGSYTGFDIVESGIRWCRKNISIRYPNFSFERIDLYSRHYNPHGKICASEWVFPWKDNSFDFVLLGSIFTHLMEQDVKHYVSEISRILRPNGTMWATGFLLDAEARTLLANGKSRINLQHPIGNSIALDSRFPESAIGHDEADLLDWIARNGLATKLLHGNWCGRSLPGDHGSHDTIIARKA